MTPKRVQEKPLRGVGDISWIPRIPPRPCSVTKDNIEYIVIRAPKESYLPIARDSRKSLTYQLLEIPERVLLTNC